MPQDSYADTSDRELFSTTSHGVGKTLWLIVFDLDGTLIDSSRDLCSAVNAALHDVGCSELSQAAVSSFIGDGAAALVKRALEASMGLPGLAVGEVTFQRCFAFFLQYYRAHKLDTTKVYPGVMESLEEIRSLYPELVMAVLTNKPVRPSREICDALGLSRYFQLNYGGDSFSTKKPAPEGLQAIMHEARLLQQARSQRGNHLLPNGVAMVGDSEADVLVGKACGVYTLGCTYGLAPEAIRLAGPAVLVDSPWQWKHALGL